MRPRKVVEQVFSDAADLLYQAWVLMPLLFVADLTVFHAYCRAKKG